MDSYQLQGYGQPFPLTTADHAGPGVQALAQAQRVQDLFDNQLLCVWKQANVSLA